jgi:hypothetical protein
MEVGNSGNNPLQIGNGKSLVLSIALSTLSLLRFFVVAADKAKDIRETCRLKGFRCPVKNGRYSARNASSGEIKLARNAGINDAAKADNPSVTTATNVTTGLYGFRP